MRIQIVGAGSWGLALARLLALNGHAFLGLAGQCVTPPYRENFLKPEVKGGIVI